MGTAKTEHGFGFAGCKSVDARWGLLAAPGDTACIFGVDGEVNRRFGQPNPGAATYLRHSTAILKSSSLAAKLSTLASRAGFEAMSFSRQIVDVGLLTQSARLSATLHELGETCGRLKRPTSLIACDHTASFWFASGLAKVRNFHYVYLDAHLDLGWHNEDVRAAPHNGTFVSHLLTNRQIVGVTNIGGRAISTFDPCYANPPITIVRFDDKAPDRTAEHLTHLAGQTIYLSIDMDVVDPSSAPNVSCPEPCGPSILDVLHVVLWLAKHCAIIGVDLCEILPDASMTWSAQGGAYFVVAALNARQPQEPAYD